MLKRKVTNKETASFAPIYVKTGSIEEREGVHFAYNCGVYGWNYDLIDYDGKFYITGYRVPLKYYRKEAN
jgi:hypothetical protein